VGVIPLAMYHRRIKIRQNSLDQIPGKPEFSLMGQPIDSLMKIHHSSEGGVAQNGQRAGGEQAGISCQC
jgi:hypothetical protein